MNEVIFARYEDVTAALADPALVPPPATPGRYGTVAWLRSAVARFSAGEPHARRRALVLADLARLDQGLLRTLAAGGYEPDVRLRVVRVLATALGLAGPEAVARDVKAVARAYFDPAPDDPAADAAVARLLPAMGDADAETAANRIGLLVQACEATAALVEHARRGGVEQAGHGGAEDAGRGGAEDAGCGGVEQAGPGGGAPDLAAVLREDPPVRVMRRLAARATVVGGVAVPAGARVLLDLDAAREPGREPLAFGAGPRPCPGRAHALVIAEGILYGASDPADGSVPPAQEQLGGAEALPDGAEALPDGAEREQPGRAETAALVPATVRHVLALADTWTAWDGRPVVNADGRTYTPHKVVRRVADHLLDHLAEVEARLAGAPTAPDHWHASLVTTPADLAPFTAADLDEARSRLTRLGAIWAHRVAALPERQLDDSPGTGWSIRQIVRHLAEAAAYYADSLGPVGPVGPADSPGTVGPVAPADSPGPVGAVGAVPAGPVTTTEEQTR